MSSEFCSKFFMLSSSAKILGTAVKLGASGRPKHRLKRQYDNTLSPDKSMMPLSYDLEIFHEYLVPKRKLRRQISAS